MKAWVVLRQRTFVLKKRHKDCQVAVCRYGHPCRRHPERPRNFFLQQAGSRRVPQNGFCGENGRRLECAGEEALQNPCPFRIRWKLDKEKTWTISVLASKHVCPSHLHTWRSAADAKWLAEVLANKVTSNPKIGVGQLRDTFRTEYGRQASYTSTWHGREIVLSHMGGGDAKSFQSIPAVCARLKAVDPNGHVDWEPQPDSRAFRRMFVCPSASGRSFPFMRPHVALDACHSKNQRYPSFIMLATCLDGNNNISILAYAIVDRENEENWVWFLIHLRGAMTGIESQEIQYVSDRCKGIINAVRNIFPGASHVHCTIHLQRNVKQRFGTEMEKFFKVLHRCKTEERYKQVLEAITEKNPACGQYLSNIPPALYVMYAVRRPRFSHTTSNIVEIANSAILPIMSYGPLRMCIELYLYMMEQKAKQHRLSLTLNEERLTPYAARYMATQEEDAGRMRVMIASLNEALVQSSTGDFVVTLLPECKCTCLVFKDMCLPCSHIIAFEREMRLSSERHVGVMWTSAAFRIAHLETFRPVDTSNLTISASCMAPTPMLKRGRRRINRIAGPGEHRSSANNLLAGSSGNRSLEPEEHQMLVELLVMGPIAQQRNPRLCSICKLPGHDRRTCGRQESGNRHPSQHSTLTGVESQLEGVEGVESQGVEGLESEGVEVEHATDDDSGEDNISMSDDDLDFEGIHDEEVDDVPFEFLL
ncbi:hypothetical protein R1sor_007931 [Riccia sorocarpa]|uniref:SWIM-type domain-containing protein n=1 Tax=Riccia sorocarpa TaxID=122646 RepID=A0ABD3HW03_9MARC